MVQIFQLLHTVELLDWYTGGPKPKILKVFDMKKILITRRLLKACEEKASKIFDVKLNKNDELYSQSKLIELSQGCDGILTSITDKIDEDTINKLPDL